MNYNKNPIVDFLIVGAMKSGTTTLGTVLNQHPDIFCAKKEIHFFNNNFDKGVGWYNEKIQKDDNFSLQKKRFGEKTPTYSAINGVPEKIYSINKKMKMIWILRNPIDRAISHYHHGVYRGAFHESLEKVLKSSKHSNDKPHVNPILRSMYFMQIEDYLHYFPVEKMHFLLFEEFLGNPDKELKKIQKFLDVPEYKLKLVEKNPTRYTSKFPKINLLLPNNYFIRELIFWLNRKKIKTEDKQLSSETKKYLQNIFLAPNRLLSKLTGLDLSCWKK